MEGLRPTNAKSWLAFSGFWTTERLGKTFPPSLEVKAAVHRSFVRWVKMGAFEALFAAMGSIVKERTGFKLYECYINGTFSKANGRGNGIGCTKAGKGVKIIIMVDAQGLPIAVNTGSSSPHESTLVEPLFDFMISVNFPEKLIGDKAYDSDRLDEALAARGVKMISPHRANRKLENKTQDGRPLRRNKRPWTIERIISWLQNYRRLCIRWEKSTLMFQSFIHLTCTILLMKEISG